jgi:type VI secretion system secreted protein VgrG
VVVGPPGIEIYNDKYGRVKVHFHWDRYGNKDGQDSCWVRVASPWAGTSVGVISVPRVGQEVVVDYEHGDPQRPLITGCVYNAQQMPPWGLPTSNTQSGLMSRSTPGGMADNFNAVRFENAKGSEKLWIHAERDMDVDVKNNLDVDVGADHRETIHGKRDITVKQGDKLTVESGGRTEIINGAELHVTEGKRTEIIDQGRKVTVKEEDELRVKGGQKVRIGDGQEVTIEGRQGVTIGGGQEVTIETGDHMTKVVEGGYTVHAKGEIKHISDATKYEWITGLSNSLTGVSNSVTGVSNSVTGLSGDITGLSVDITGLSVDITGLSVDIKGIEIGEKPIEIHNKNVEVNINTAVNVAIAVINLEMLNLTVVM